MTDGDVDVLLERADHWLAADPDPVTQRELRDLIARGDHAELAERFRVPAGVGTAGFRAPVGGGPARMNRAVAIRMASGLAAHVSSAGSARTGLLIVGFDGRRESRVYAEDVVGVLGAAGLSVRFFGEPVPTPLIAFAARELRARAAVVITASHNPRQYNGYKLYGADAVQMSVAEERAVSSHIERVGRACDVPRLDSALTRPYAEVAHATSGIIDRYLEELAAFFPGGGAGAPDMDIVYTPLHGVGWDLLRRALGAAGFARVRVVPEQAAPDGAFPTVAFPNPEEPGTLDRALELAGRTTARLVLANDPDADRLAAAVRDSGEWFVLSGNQIGALLLEQVLAAAGGGSALVASSLVTSPLIAAVAAHHGARHLSTPTGFKWICGMGLDLARRERLHFVFACEEALGFALPDLVHDKDGISAAVLFADLARRREAAGSTVLEALAELSLRHGLWVSTQKSVVLEGSDGASRMRGALESLRREPPAKLGDQAVVRFVDHGLSSEPQGPAALDLLELTFDGGRLLLRPSGTEPKLKLYVDLRREYRPSADFREQHAAARTAAEGLAAHLLSRLELDRRKV